MNPQEMLDDISQISDLSLKSLFNDHTPQWKIKRDEFIQPFYPRPQTRNGPVSYKNSLSKLFVRWQMSITE